MLLAASSSLDSEESDDVDNKEVGVQPLFEVPTSLSRFRSRGAGRDFDAPLQRSFEFLVSEEEVLLVHGRCW